MLPTLLRFPFNNEIGWGVLNVVINNTYSTINLFDMHVQSDLANLVETLQANDTDVRVVVFSSANKEFFIGHIDVEYFLPGYALLWNITQLPQATIAVIEGRTRGIGNEFLMSCDMRFASTSPSVLISQLETSLGVNPGAGGGMYLARLIGRGLAFEYVLSSADVDARTAARVGWVNAAFDTPRELHAHVRALAARIAMFPAAGIIATKTGINAATRPSREEIVNAAQNVIAALLPTPAVQGAFRRFIHVTRNQSIGKMELDYGAEVGRLFE
ncbi:enoyl-CoA hydratase/isomerase-like protein [Mycena olivaceomarginata]|nr:enoyl-CoA hydratase/isomerase-like protein [Mycena olivaceomarginata]